MRTLITCALLLCCYVAFAPPPTTSPTGVIANQFSTNKTGVPIKDNVIFGGRSNMVIGDLVVSGRLGMGTASAQILSISSLVIPGEYNPTNFIPIPGKVRIAASNYVIYFVSKEGGTNALK